MHTFITVRSASKKYDGGDIISAIKQFEYALLIRTDKVELIRTQNPFDIANLTEVRAFDKNSELHLICVNGEWRGRIRTDGAGDEVEVLDQKQLLWGKCEDSSNGVSLLREDRGIEIKVPVEISVGMRAYFEIRSYLAADRFEFTDFRICGIGVTEVKADE